MGTLLFLCFLEEDNQRMNNVISAHFVACTRDEVDSKYPTPKQIILPRRGTPRSAGYDFYSPYEIVIPPHQSVFFPAWVKCIDMPTDVVLKIFVRSSLGIKKGLCLSNSTGIIDSDYIWGIGVSLYNRGDNEVKIEEGERFAQGIFEHYLITCDDEPIESERTGGFGSTGTK